MIQVREFAKLTTRDVEQSIETAKVSHSTFEWLLKLGSIEFTENPLFTLLDSETIRINSFVGYLESPSGETIEILPKINQHTPDSIEIEKTRRSLKKMVGLMIGSNSMVQVGEASLSTMNEPIHEWIVAQFILELEFLIRKGIRFDYEEVQEECNYLKGRLNTSLQARQSPARLNYFNIKYEVFTPNKIENRLIKSALEYVIKLSLSNHNWKKANELLHFLEPVNTLVNPKKYISSWSKNRLMKHYDAIKPWTDIILNKLNPSFQTGGHRGIALLFPMERLFEIYVTRSLSKVISKDFLLQSQSSSRTMLEHMPNHVSVEKWFKLKPDIIIKSVVPKHVLDVKWKLLNQNLSSAREKYGISQADIYQLYAYGKKYLLGEGTMMLIYPKHESFSHPLPIFRFDRNLTLWCVPFDIFKENLVSGEWLDDFKCFMSSAH